MITICLQNPFQSELINPIKKYIKKISLPFQPVVKDTYNDLFEIQLAKPINGVINCVSDVAFTTISSLPPNA